MAGPPGGNMHSKMHSEMAYAVHTSTCTYLLDDDGICRWIVSQQGMVPSHVRQCIGAQFVACLDVSVEGALVPQLRVGGRALFVQHTGDRMVMLRTGPIQHVDDRRAEGDDAPALATPLTHSGHGEYGKPPLPTPKAPPRRRKAPQPPPSFGTVRYHGEEQTITINRAFGPGGSGGDEQDADVDFMEMDMPTRRR